MCQLSNDVMIQILNQLPLTDLLTLSSVSRRWREASQLFIDSSSLCLFYRFALDCAYPAFISLNGHYFQEEKCIKFRRMAEFGNSSLARRVERIASYYPVVLSDPGALPAPLFMMAHKMPNVLVLEYVGNDTQIFYTVPGRPTLRILFPKLTQISMFCDFDLFRMKIESLRAEDYMPKVKLDVKANFLVAVVAAFAEIDRFIECLRADDLVNHQQFKLV